MRNIGKVIGIVVSIAGVMFLVALLVGFPIMWLWNALMPDIFGLPTINFWQALGLTLLSAMLFGKVSSSSKSK